MIVYSTSSARRYISLRDYDLQLVHCICLRLISFGYPSYRGVRQNTKKENVLNLKYYVCYWRRDLHFSWPTEPREGLAAKAVPSFLGYFPEYCFGPGNRTCDLPLSSIGQNHATYPGTLSASRAPNLKR